jgi:hypothetical protein
VAMLRGQESSKGGAKERPSATRRKLPGAKPNKLIRKARAR